MRHIIGFKLFESDDEDFFSEDAIFHKKLVMDIFQDIIDTYNMEKYRISYNSGGIYYNIFDIGEEYNDIYLNISAHGSFTNISSLPLNRNWDLQKDIKNFMVRLNTIGYKTRMVYNTTDNIQIEINYSEA